MLWLRLRSMVVLVLALAPTLLAGCNPASKVVGKWQLETDKVQSGMPPIGGDNPMAAALASSMLEMMKFEMDLEFKGDGSCQFHVAALGQSHDTAGQWRYLKTDGDCLVLMIKSDDQPEEREVRIRLLDDDHLETTSPVEAAAAGGPKTLPFKRVKT